MNAMDFKSLVVTRQSDRSYHDRPIENEKLMQILECARLSPSACNAQPWHIIVVNDPEIKNYIYKATFKNENLIQVLNLLKLSAPIDYRVTNRKMLTDGNFTKQKVFIMKKKS